MKKNICILITLLLLPMLTACATGGKKKPQADAFRRLGEVYLSQGQYSAALKELLQAEKLHSDNHLLHDDLGRVYLAKKRYDLAIRHFKKALSIRPAYAVGKNNLGAAYIMNNQWDEAIDTFHDLSANLLYATPHFPQYNLGWAYHNKGRFQKALAHYDAALELQPGFVLALRGKGLTYLELGQLSDAIAMFEKATEKSPPFPQLYLDMGRAYVSARAYDKATQAFERVVAIAPDSPAASHALSEQAKLATILNQ